MAEPTRCLPPVTFDTGRASVFRHTLPRYMVVITGRAEFAGMEAIVHGYTDNKVALQKRLRRIEGQVRGLQRMVDEDQYCIDVLTQISAVTKALEAVALTLLEGHLHHCVSEAIVSGGPEAQAKITEASDAIRRLVRS